MSQRATNSREPSGAEARAAAEERSAAEAASSLLASVTPARLALLSHSQLVDVVADLLAMARRSERMQDEKLDTAVHKMAQRKRAGGESAPERAVSQRCRARSVHRALSSALSHPSLSVTRQPRSPRFISVFF